MTWGKPLKYGAEIITDTECDNEDACDRLGWGKERNQI